MSHPRAALAALATLAACTLTPFGAQAQPSSTAPTIKFIITHPAGGLPDTVARIVGRRMQERLNQTIVVENRSGANGGIAVNALTSAPADGTTFVVTDGAIMSINPQLYSKLPYNPKDVAPVAVLATAPLFLAVHPSMPVTNMKEFIAHVKANPGKYNIGSSGIGSIHHISLEALKTGLGLQISHIPYKGTGEAVPALLGGHVQMLFSAYPSLAGAAGTKRITLLATNGVDALLAGARAAGDLRIHPGLQLCAVRRHLCARRHVAGGDRENLGGSGGDREGAGGRQAARESRRRADRRRRG